MQLSSSARLSFASSTVIANDRERASQDFDVSACKFNVTRPVA
jgi:hypothetical protein